MNGKQVAWVAAAALGVGVALWLALGPDDGSAELADAVRDTDTGEELVLAGLWGGDWDSFTVVCPYDPRDEVEARLAPVSARGVPNLEMRDGEQALVLIAEGAAHPVRVIPVPSARLDLCEGDPWGVEPASAVLVVERPAHVPAVVRLASG